MKNKLFYWVSIGTLLLALGTLITFMYWKVYPYTIDDFITFNVPPLQLVTKEVRRGEALRWNVDVTHHTKGIKVDVVRQIEDGYIINFPTVAYVTTGERQVFVNSIVIPDYAIPGKYRLRATSIWHVNPIRTITFPLVSEEFIVK